MLIWLETYFYEAQFSLLFGGIFLLFLIEAVLPRSRKGESSDQSIRWLNNISLAFINFLVVLFVIGFIGSLYQSLLPDYSLIREFQIPDLLALAIVLLLIEFLIYWIHRAYHRYAVLWRIHAVHHSDTHFDVTTSNRHHPFELILNSIILLPIIMLLGASFWVLIFHSFTSILVNLFAHGNIKIPNWLDKALRKIIVTPDFHRLHHSSNRQYSDSNFGVIFPWFDYLFKTATRLPRNEIPDIEIGLERLRDPKDNRIDKLLAIPFTYNN